MLVAYAAIGNIVTNAMLRYYKQPEYWPNLIMGVFQGQSLLLVPTIFTYVKFCYIEHFSVKRYQNFEGMGRSLWIVMVLSNALKGFTNIPYEQGCFFLR